MPTKATFDTELTEYQRAWTSMMLKIWEEKLLMLGVRYTGNLQASLTGNIRPDLVTFRFLQYGIYVDSGVGYNYKGHNGDLQFLDEGYREEHGLNIPKRVGPAWGGQMTSGNPRKAKPWFNKKYFASVMKLKDDLVRIIGQEFVGIVQSVSTK